MSDHEVPEADALEQAQPADDPHRPIDPAAQPAPAADVPEADAHEQAQEVPDASDEAR